MAITFQDVTYTYETPGGPGFDALKNINIEIPKGSYTAIIGHTGSGKSTIVQHLNALLKPTKGRVIIGDRVISADTTNKNLKEIRRKVGVVFQFPEAQLFDETVLKDVMFGPKNFGASEEDAEKMAREALALVGITDETILQRSPFDLSGGQMRRVAIAGVLSMNPEILVLDEPSAGLDPQGREDMMELFQTLHDTKGLTIVLITHQMNDVAEYADHVIVLEKGQVVKTGAPKEIFADSSWLDQVQLGEPDSLKFLIDLEQKIRCDYDAIPLTTEELAEFIGQLLRGEVVAECAPLPQVMAQSPIQNTGQNNFDDYYQEPVQGTKADFEQDSIQIGSWQQAEYTDFDDYQVDGLGGDADE